MASSGYLMERCRSQFSIGWFAAFLYRSNASHARATTAGPLIEL
jgi:hypothetical protein